MLKGDPAKCYPMTDNARSRYTPHSPPRLSVIIIKASGHLYSRRGQYTALQCGKIRYIIEFQCSAPWVSFATKENHHDVLMDY